jgi:hypothetical protein
VCIGGVVAVMLIAASTSAAAGWIAPVNLSQLVDQDASTPQVAIDAAGDTAVVWTDDAAHRIVQVATRPSGGAFSTPVNLSAATGDASDPRIAVDQAGDATVVWSWSDGTRQVVQASTRPAGGTFSAAVDLSAAGENASFPQVAVDGAGDTTVVWTGQTVQASTRSPGGDFSVPVDVSAAGVDVGSPALGVDTSGETVVAWSRASTIETAFRSAGGAFGAPVGVSTAGTPAISPEVAIGNDGSAALVWDQPMPSGGVVADEVVEGAARDPGGAFGLPTDLSAAGIGPGELHVAIDGSGTAIAVWEQLASGSASAQFSVRPPGGSFAAATSFPETQITDPDVAMNPAGEAVVVWSGIDPAFGNFAIQGVTRPAGGAFSTPARVSAGGQNAFGPTVAINSAGDAFATWEGSGPGGNEVASGAALDSTPPAVSAISVPASGTAGTPVSMSASASDQWGPATVSFAFGDGATQTGSPAGHTYAAGGNYQVTVTATDAGGNQTSATRSISIAGLPQPPASKPANASRPAISGGRRVGTHLSCSPGVWTGTAPITYAYQWLSDGHSIGHATSATYTTTTGDVGHEVSCSVTGSNVAGSASATTAGVAVTAAPACAGLLGSRLLDCRARQTYTAAVKTCGRIRATSAAGHRRRTTCTGRAKTSYKRAIAVVKCRATPNARKRAVCVARARKLE